MSNSKLATYTLISPNHGSRNHAIDTITIHCTAGNKDNTAKQIANVSRFTTYSASSGASCNYAVGGDGSIAVVVNEADKSWCSSNVPNDHRAVTIEVASNTTGTEVNTAAYNSLVDLVTDICQRNGIGKLVWSESKSDRVNHKNGCNMTCHRDYANKACPGEWLYSREGQIAQEVNKRLTTGSGTSGSEEDDDMDIDKLLTEMTDEQAYKLLAKAQSYAGQIAEPAWSQKEGHFATAEKDGVMDGTRPEAYVKRDELAAVLGRKGLL